MTRRSDLRREMLLRLSLIAVLPYRLVSDGRLPNNCRTQNPMRQAKLARRRVIPELSFQCADRRDSEVYIPLICRSNRSVRQLTPEIRGSGPEGTSRA